MSTPWHDLDAFIDLPRASSLALSPDGTWLLAGIQTLSSDQTSWRTALWRIPVDGSGARRLTRGEEGEQAACLLPDGSVVFTARRPVPAQEGGDEKDVALWCLPSEGGEALVLTRRRGGWGTLQAARTASRLVSAVGLRAGLESLADDTALQAEREKKKVRAILHEGAGVRYWDEDLPSSTIRFVTLDVTRSEDEEGGAPCIDPEAIRLATRDRGREVRESFVLSSDGSFALVDIERHRAHADRTSHVARVDLGSGTFADVARDDRDEYRVGALSPDDRWLACHRSIPSTTTEAPHVVLHLVDLRTGGGRDVAADWPCWAEVVAFSPDASTLYVAGDLDGDLPIFGIDLATDEVRRITDHGVFSQMHLSSDGKTLYALHSAIDIPGEVVRIDVATGEVTPLASPLRYPDLPGRLERVETTASDGTRIPAWLCLPESASVTQPVPLALWIHGGPLNSWNAWSWRWCPWLMVSQGHAVLLPDPALSTGYGHAAIQRGWGRWGEEPYTDLMEITDAVQARDDIDVTRTYAMGGSFGGYMANWIAGHTERFRCIVSHASLWDLTSFASATDAPWYWNREMSPEMMRANSPHLFAEAITTPMLVIHGDRDYRVPVGQGLALWWALTSGHDGDESDLPHRFLYFPDENHWVLSPQHAIVWYETVRSFVGAHVDETPFARPPLL